MTFSIATLSILKSNLMTLTITIIQATHVITIKTFNTNHNTMLSVIILMVILLTVMVPLK